VQGPKIHTQKKRNGECHSGQEQNKRVTHHDFLVFALEIHCDSKRIAHETLVQLVKLILVPSKRVKTRFCANSPRHRSSLHHRDQMPRIVGAGQELLDIFDLSAYLNARHRQMRDKDVVLCTTQHAIADKNKNNMKDKLPEFSLRIAQFGTCILAVRIMTRMAWIIWALHLV
jgi:hypothetical protein